MSILFCLHLLALLFQTVDAFRNTRLHGLSDILECFSGLFRIFFNGLTVFLSRLLYSFFRFLLIYTSVFSLILRFSQFFKTTRLPHAGILRHLVSEAAGRSDLRVQQTERRSLKFFEKAFCVPASPAVA